MLGERVLSLAHADRADQSIERQIAKEQHMAGAHEPILRASEWCRAVSDSWSDISRDDLALIELTCPGNGATFKW